VPTDTSLARLLTDIIFMHLIYSTDNRSVPSIGTGDYGWLVVPSLYVNLISVSKLCNDYDFLTIFDKKRALILDRTLQSSSSDADYDPLLGQAEHGLIPFQTLILSNTWFLKEVVARLQRNEDAEASYRSQ
jgi:hypothetical protein